MYEEYEESEELVEFEELTGKKIINVLLSDDNTELALFTKKYLYRMYHEQGCCENVYIDEIHGDLEKLKGSTIITAEVSTNSDQPKKGEYDESWTWTFYKIQHSKGFLTIRWYGASNGYYSETVDIQKMRKMK